MVRQGGAVHAGLCPHPRPRLLRGNSCQLWSEATDFQGHVLWMSRTWRDRWEGWAGVRGPGKGGGEGWGGGREEGGGNTPTSPSPLPSALGLPDPLDCSALSQNPLALAPLPVSSLPRAL